MKELVQIYKSYNRFNSVTISQRPWKEKIINFKHVDAAVVNHFFKHLWNLQNFTDFFGPLIGLIYIVCGMYGVNLVDPTPREEIEAMPPIRFVYHHALWLTISSQTELLLFVFLVTARGSMSFLRLFGKTRYLVKMVQNVFWNLGPFVYMTSLLICSFSVTFMIIDTINLEVNNFEGSYRKALMFMYNVFMGENDDNIEFNEFRALLKLKYLVQFFFFIIIMNLNISVVGKIYNDTRGRIHAINCRLRAEMMLEVSDYRFNIKDDPKFIFYVRQKTNQEDFDQKKEEEQESLKAKFELLKTKLINDGK
jgi:hypothetical protein